MEWLTVSEAVKLTGLHRISVYRLAARLEGTSHTKKVGRTRLISGDYLRDKYAAKPTSIKVVESTPHQEQQQAAPALP